MVRVRVKKRAANVGPKPKRRRAARSEREVEHRSLTDLPVELCNEIFCNLGASDLLRIARVNKATRNYLMRASMFKVWNAAAKRECPNMPECPEDVTLPGWLSLILEKHCRFCGANGVRNVMWELKTRACKDCLLESPALLRVSTDDRDPELDLQKLQFLLPFSFIEVPARYREAYRAYFVFLEADFEEFVAKEAGDEKVYANWMNERTLAMKVNRRRGHVYSWWYSAFEEDQKHRRYQEGAELRRGQIKRRLAEEGWMDDLRVLERDLAKRGSRFKDHPLFAKGGPLKDSEWKGIKQHILGILKDEGARMKDRPRKAKRV